VVGERTFRRWCQRYEEDGEAGLLEPAAGQAPQAGSGDRADEVGSALPHTLRRLHGEAFSRAPVKDHRFNWSYTDKTFLQSRGFLEKAGAAVRIGASVASAVAACCCIRTGRGIDGLRGSRCSDLIVTLDDATSRSIRRSWWRKEGTASTLPRA